MDGEVRKREAPEKSADHPMVSSRSLDQQQQRRLFKNNPTPGFFLDVEVFVGTVVDAVNDLTFEGFNSMEEYAVQQLQLESEDEQQALKQGVDSIYSKVQDNIDESLHRWESMCRYRYFNKYPPKSLTTSNTEKITRNGSKNCSGEPCVEDGHEEILDTELRSLQSQLVAAHRAGAKIRAELTSFEKHLAVRREVLSDVTSFEESFDRDVLEETLRSADLLKNSIKKASISQEKNFSQKIRVQLENHFPEQSLEDQISALKVPDGLEYGDPAIVDLLG